MNANANDPNQASLTALSVDAGYDSHVHRSAPLQLHNIDLNLKPGEIVAVIGPNGSGKSTLVRVLSRTLAPAKGAVLLNSADLYLAVNARESARSIGVVPQNSDFFLDFTVRDIVSMGRAPMRRSQGPLEFESLEDEIAVNAALERMSMPDELASRPISQVSGGERQRALIARALAQEAEILLLDEPTSSLDLYHQAHLLNWLRRLAAVDGKAILVVLHDLNLAGEYADRLVVLSKGRVVASGPTASVLTADMVRDVYNVRSWIRQNPLTGRPVAMSMESINVGRTDLHSLPGRRVHLFCGAGTGASLMFQLCEAGAVVTACALQEGDLDEEAAAHLNIEHARASAFCRPSAEELNHANELAFGAELSVLTDVPIGETNSDIAQQVSELAQFGRLVLVESPRGRVNENLAALQERLRKFENVTFSRNILGDLVTQAGSI